MIINSIKNERNNDAMCEKSLPGQSQSNSWSHGQRTPLQDGDHSGNDPQLVPGFLAHCSGIFRERFR